MSEKEKKTERVVCNDCGPAKKHTLLHSVTKKGGSPDFDIQWESTYDMLQCDGCEDVTLRRTFWHSEMSYDDSDVVYYPPRVARELPKWKGKLDSEVCQLMEEVYLSLNANSRRLSMMGARALMDIVMLDIVGDVGGFAEKLAELEKVGHIGSKNRRILMAALDVGNAASHRGYNPTSDNANHVMDIIENIIQSTLLDDAAQQLKLTTPPRKKKSTT